MDPLTPELVTFYCGSLILNSNLRLINGLPTCPPADFPHGVQGLNLALGELS